ncbi:LytTR family DNA-binding domain-containing protein [Nitrospirillum sp. BR 11164]|uniref:LytTR family DNA-binding domain-containing protein n=1 Tax=Nitrospirillum sp. BR 11164 TaxID=3104324 RepID=UPI002AFF24E7|nr:LytTR family DNA-binding domain-containing protein [Nitrospirillum sp. BR 11164]MEA1650807.1 LytTR family DNA-binding domain-containing protein [Nitrospirillum sp. BR 11164]
MSTAPAAEATAQAVMLPGWRLSARATWALVWLVFYFLPTTINVLSVLSEHKRDGRPIAAWEPMCWEYSSALGGLAALPLVYLGIRRAPGWARAPLRTLGLHLVMMAAYGAVHIGLMMGLRVVVYAAVGGHYHSAGSWADIFLYEFRKDSLTYLIAAAILTMGRQLVRLSRVVALVEAQQAAPVSAPATAPAVVEPPARLELKVGTRRVFVAPEEIIQVSAAGKYVEVMTAERVHLVRRSLADIQSDLPPQLFVRVHRSRLLNRATIQRVDSRPSGDLDITLTTGLTVTASRRYKAELLQA